MTAKTITDTQAAAIAYVCRHNGGTLPEGRAVEFFADGQVYRVQACGAYQLHRAEHWQDNRWAKVDAVPADAKAAACTTMAAPSHMIAA